MPLALCTASHSPLMGRRHPAQDVVARVEAALESARAFVRSFDPELVIIFGPDHYNGFFYDMMPPFCIGAAATSVGDYGLPAGPLPVDGDMARELARAVLGAGVDVAVSERMHVDHGFCQPLELLFGAIDALPVVPVFINCVAEPLGPAGRARLLGAAIGRAVAASECRILLVGSGGLSHDPPVPRLAEAPPEVAAGLIAGRNPTTEARAARESRVIAASSAFVEGTSGLLPLNPDWDAEFLQMVGSGELDRVDAWSNEWCVEQAGHSSHEVRTWIAAYAALAMQGPYTVESTFYEAIPEWIAGFGITTARPAT